MKPKIVELEKELDDLRCFILWIINEKFREPKVGRKDLLNKFREEFDKR